MTRNISNLVRRAYEHFVASIAAVSMTTLLLVSVNAHAAAHNTPTPSVSVLVPTVTVLVPSVTIEEVN